MGERKVLIRYVPPDFDPSILPKFKREKNKLMDIRMMLPFSLRCNTCGEYMYQGKKFNSKKEDCVGEDYLGIRRFRFYIKCVVCNSEISFKTDPKNSDYELESGASRNFEVWRETAEATEEVQKEREEEEEFDAMKALENRTNDSKLEMDILDALDEIKAINQRHERVDTAKALNALHRKSESEEKQAVLNEHGLTAEDEALVKSIKFGANAGGSSNGQSSSSSCMIRNASTKAAAFVKATHSVTSAEQESNTMSGNKRSALTVKPVIVTKKKKVETEGIPKSVDSIDDDRKASNSCGGVNSCESNAAGLGLLMSYGSDDSD